MSSDNKELIKLKFVKNRLTGCAGCFYDTSSFVCLASDNEVARCIKSDKDGSKKIFVIDEVNLCKK